jgi:xylem cysteine proteinase
MDYAFSFIVSNGGIHKEDDYPYLMEDGTCENKKVSRKPIVSGLYISRESESFKLIRHELGKRQLASKTHIIVYIGP